MENYRRDDFWDAATWADIDQAALAEAQQIRVARKVFRTEDLSDGDRRRAVLDIEGAGGPSCRLAVTAGIRRSAIHRNLRAFSVDAGTGRR